MKYYELKADPPSGKGEWGEIKFRTPDVDMYSLVMTMVCAITDAERWRSQVMQIRTIECEDGDGDA